VLALSSVQVRLKHVEKDIEQVILEPEILVGNEGNQKAFAAQWLTCRLPCQRFVSHLAMRYA